MKWISVKDRLPESSDRDGNYNYILIWAINTHCGYKKDSYEKVWARYDDKEKLFLTGEYDCAIDIHHVSHWLDEIEPPKDI